MKSIATMVHMHKTEKEEIIERVLQRLQEMGLDPSDFNKKLNKSEGWIYNYLHGKRKFKRAQIEVFARGLNCNPDWLQYGSPHPKDPNLGNILQFNNENSTHNENIAKSIASNETQVRIVSSKLAFVLTWQTAHQWEEIMRQTKQDNFYPKTLIEDCYNDDCFLLEIVNDSMLPRFNRGEYIVVDPHKNPKFGSFVVVRLADQKENIFAQYFEQEGKITLRFSNNLYPEISKTTENIKVIGVVRERNAKEKFE